LIALCDIREAWETADSQSVSATRPKLRTGDA
jgi:hypothetical protein